VTGFKHWRKMRGQLGGPEFNLIRNTDAVAEDQICTFFVATMIAPLTSRADQMPFKYSTRSFLLSSLRLKLNCVS
jgi:hypothetical protein